jgi:hypothetical protein
MIDVHQLWLQGLFRAVHKNRAAHSRKKREQGELCSARMKKVPQYNSNCSRRDRLQSILKATPFLNTKELFSDFFNELKTSFER